MVVKFQITFKHRASVYVSLIRTGSNNARYSCYWSLCMYAHALVMKTSCVICVLYEGCVFLCTDWEAPELSVFPIS